MKKVTFKIKILTPMFAGTAIPGQCELRPPAIKGMLRFWWRALNGGLEDLHKREGEIFGSSDQDVGRSKFSISVRHELKRTIPDFKGKGKLVPLFGRFTSNVLDYLAYGKHDLERNKNTGKKEIVYWKKCFLPGPESHFFMDIYFHDAKVMEEVLQVVKVWTEYGGLGSGSRSGWGKVWIEEWPQGIQEPKINYPKPSQSAYTAFSDDTVLFQCKESDSSWDKAFGKAGSVYHEVRKGLDGKDKHGNKEFKKRVMVSQPIIKDKKNVPEMFIERHAKSMFIGVRPQGKQYVGYILLMPYNYLKKANGTLVGEKLKQRDQPADEKAYQVVYKELEAKFDKKMERVKL